MNNSPPVCTLFPPLNEFSRKPRYPSCLTREQAERIVSRRPFHEKGNWDGYDMTGPSNLLRDYAEGFVNRKQVHQLLRGESPTGANYD